jgi:3-isopropylmalate/(R)-2-methylmalate dehydratase small subunit
MKSFGGKILFLDRGDINTDEIIPAKYLTELSKEALKPFTLEDLEMNGFSAKKDVAGKGAIITRANFGCGSSREHAPWALEVHGINVVIAENFARIFRQNMFNCGMMAVELPKATIDTLFATFAGKDAELVVDFDASKMTVKTKDASETFAFTIAGFDRALVKAGGWVGYADSHY